MFLRLPPLVVPLESGVPRLLYADTPLPWLGRVATQLGVPDHIIAADWRRLESRKHEVSACYTHDAEVFVDDFLSKQYSYAPDAVPWDYLDTPPTQMRVIESNLDTLMHVTAEVFLPSSAVHSKLIAPFVERVWRTQLSPLKRDLETFHEQLLTAAVHHDNLRAIQNIRTSVEKDLEYVSQMEQLEHHYLLHLHDGSPQPQKVLSDFVPVSGIVIGRLHRLENEHRTVIEHWKHRCPR